MCRAPTDLKHLAAGIAHDSGTWLSREVLIGVLVAVLRPRRAMVRCPLKVLTPDIKNRQLWQTAGDLMSYRLGSAPAAHQRYSHGPSVL